LSQSSPVELASGQLTAADSLTVELIEPTGLPAAILIKWPAAPSVVAPNPRALANVASAVVRILAGAQAKVATIKARGGKS